MTNIEKYFASFGLDRGLPRSFLKNQEIQKLFIIPKKETHEQMPIFYNFEEDNTHQADILFLPHDKVKGKVYAYALIVVDIATGDTDGEPLEFHKGWNGPTSRDVTDAIIKIYARKNLSVPKLLITDSGREFLDISFQNFLEKNDISWKKAIGGRHRQVGMVERRNYTIGRAIMMRQFAESMITQKETVHWVKEFQDLMFHVNKRFHHKPLTDTELFKKHGDPWKDLKQEMLPLGTVVRIMLTEPKDFKERGVKGHFRAGDARWTQDTYKVNGFVFDPHAPVLYKLNQKLKPHEHVAYTRQQLQVVGANEQDVPASIAKHAAADGEFAIKKLIDKRTNGNKTEYKIWWKGYPRDDATWQFKSKIPRAFVDQYEEE